MGMEENIIIIYTPRSGSTSLLNSFSESHLCLDEIFSQKKGNTFKDFLDWVLNSKKPIILKSGTDHVPKDIDDKNHMVSGPWQGPDDFDEDNFLDFFDILLPFFGTIILLDRKNTEDHLIAWNHLVYNVKSGGEVHGKYNVIENLVGDFHYYFYRSKTRLKKISDKLNQDIVYYEDIYYGDTEKFIESLGFSFTPHMKKILDTSQRYRQNEI